MAISRPRSLQTVFRNLRQLVEASLRTAAVALALVCLMPVAHVQAQTSEQSGVRDIRSLNATEKRQLLEKIRQRLKRDLGATKPFPGQVAFVPYKLKFRTETDNEALVMDLGPVNGPQLRDADMSEFAAQLDGTIADLLDELGISYPAFRYEYNGHDWYYYHPEDEKEDREHQLKYESRMQQKGNAAAIPTQGAKVAISAMHGYYWRVFEQAWALQRPTESNGIIEDFITPTFVDPLSNWLTTRSTALIYLPRSQSTAIYPVSGFPWWQMDGRENLKVIYPDNPEIWHSLSRPLPNRDPNLWQYDEDIRSRPLFANHIGADALFNLHTNAGPPTASGTRAFVAENRSYDMALANNVLCGMNELIHAQDSYTGFKVDSQARQDDHYGENRLASMPAVVLEIAFHTNASDAAALKDPVFVDAAMKGVEKGFRLQAEGKVCKPFKITSIPDVTAQRPNSVNVPVNFEGFPYFPVTLTVEYTSCPAGETCTGGTVVHNTPEDSPFVFSFECSGSSSTPSTSGWRSYMTDADGVKTNAVAHSLTCLPNTGKAANGKPSMQVVSAEL